MNGLQSELKRIQAEIKKNQALLKDPELASLAEEEITRLKAQETALEQAQNHSNGNGADPDLGDVNLDERPCTIEIRAAAGGDEAKIWADDLLRMYTRYCDTKKLKHEIIDDRVLKVKGKNAYGTFKHESGVHRVQRVPTTESQGRIHTSTATVAVLPVVSSKEVEVKEEDLDWQFTRSGGPGGQNVNKVNSAVRLTHKPTDVKVSVRQERSQQQNRELALQMLRSHLWEIEQEKQQSQIDSTRKAAVGRGMRSEKIRTYNYPQNRVTDHRIKKSWQALEAILEGNLDKVFSTLSENLS